MRKASAYRPCMTSIYC